MPEATDNVEYLPIWKKDSSAYEFLQECSMIARKHPERFGRTVIVFEETMKTGRTRLHYHSKNVTTNELLGVLTLAISHVIEDTQK